MNKNVNKLLEPLSDNNYNEMSWHDCRVYAIAFDKSNSRLLLDIDYITKWVKPNDSSEHYSFWVSPCTLIFNNVWNLKVDLETNLEMVINEITRENAHEAKNLNGKIEYDWQIELLQGEIKFKSIGYNLYLRKEPVLSQSQELSLKERGGFGFGNQMFHERL